MKKLIIMTAILITGFFTTVKSETRIINHSGFEFGFFYSNLAPYGSWIEVDAGLVVWRPTIIRKGWSPYRHGRWIWTVDGWYWDSYEPFGHIVFHYGRWYYDDYYGWIWIPDYDYAPAWVEWRYDNDYIGWAPLPPYAVFSIGIGIHYTHSYYVPYHHWHYVTYNRFCDPYVYNYYVAPKYKYRIHNRTKVRNNYGYRNGYVVNNGVDIDHIRKQSGQNIKQRDIIRVKDYKEAEKYRGKNDDVVRTFVASRDEITRSRTSDVKIKKENKRSTLDVSKVRIGRDNINERNLDVNKERSAVRNNDSKKNDVIIKDRNNNSDVQKKDVNIQRNNDVNRKTEVRKENTNDNRTKVQQQKKEVQRKEVNIQKNKNNDVNRKTEVRKESINDNRTKVQQQKKEVQRKEVNIQRNNDVNRKTEVRKETSNNNRTNVQQQKKEVQRKEGNIQKNNDVNRKTQVRTEQKRNNSQNKTKSEDSKVERNSSDNNKKRNR